MNLKKVPKWAWIVAGLVAVGVFIYFKRKGASSTSASTTPPQGTDASGVDESQLSSDLAAQLAAALGGSPDQGGATSSPDQEQLIQDLMSMIGQSQGEFNSLASTLYGSGVIYGGQTAPGQSPGQTTVPGTGDPYATTTTPTISGGPGYDPYNPWGASSPFVVPAAPNTAGIAGVTNPGAPVPSVFTTSGQNVTGVAGVLQPLPPNAGAAVAGGHVAGTVPVAM